MPELLSALRPPWDFPSRELDISRILVINNSSVAWALGECQYWCALRGIPAENIMSFPLGTIGYYDPGLTLMADLIGPVRAKMLQIGATALVAGPGCPPSFRVPLLSFVGPGYTVSPTEYGFPPFTYFLASAKNFSQPDGSTFAALGALGNFGMYTFLSGAIVAQEMGSFPRMLGLSTGDESNVYELHKMQTVGITEPSILVATEYAVERVHAGLGRGMPFGRLGYSAWQGLPSAETQASTRAIIDRATIALRQVEPGVGRTLPSLMSIASVSGTPALALACLTSLMRSWGMNVKYYWHGETPVAEAETFAPLAASAYTWAQVQAGLAVQDEYYFQLGAKSNNEMYTVPFTTNWRPTPSIGTSAVAGASDGYKHNLHALASQSACAGFTDESHQTVSGYSRAFTAWHNLLRGMTYLESSFYTEFGNSGKTMPCGDPLVAPFRNDRNGIITRRRRR